MDPLWRSGPALRELRAAGVETQALSSAVCCVFTPHTGTTTRVTRSVKWSDAVCVGNVRRSPPPVCATL